jgi:hypothetical protein
VTARRWVAVLCLGLLAACGAAKPRWAPDALIQKHRYAPTAPTEVRLYTVVSTRNGSGAHSALLITTSRERILFDPAGSFELPSVPERNDVLHGISPRALAVYIDFHARESYDVIEQRLRVSDAQARQIAALAKSHGAVPDAQCALSINRILRQVDGFGVMRPTYFPNATRQNFARLPGVETRVFRDDDPDSNMDVLRRAAR